MKKIPNYDGGPWNKYPAHLPPSDCRRSTSGIFFDFGLHIIVRTLSRRPATLDVINISDIYCPMYLYYPIKVVWRAKRDTVLQFSLFISYSLPYMYHANTLWILYTPQLTVSFGFEDNISACFSQFSRPYQPKRFEIALRSPNGAELLLLVKYSVKVVVHWWNTHRDTFLRSSWLPDICSILFSFILLFSSLCDSVICADWPWWLEAASWILL